MRAKGYADRGRGGPFYKFRGRVGSVAALAGRRGSNSAGIFRKLVIVESMVYEWDDRAIEASLESERSSPSLMRQVITAGMWLDSCIASA